MGVQVRGIMGEKVLLLIAALELWPALWSTKDRSDTLQWLGLANICPTGGMPRFSPPRPPLQTQILTLAFSSLSELQSDSPEGANADACKLRTRKKSISGAPSSVIRMM